MKPDTHNNFDLIRLFAALQVVIIHVGEHLKLPGFPDHLIFKFLTFIPGVPIFFFVSGYLITASAERSPNWRLFFTNRALRIFPALWWCLVVSILLVWVTGYFSTVDVSAAGFAIWIAAQTTIVQFYNPGFLQGFGVGALNGSLWSISVELQFYLLLPLIAALILRSRSALIIVFLLFLAINTWFTQVIKASDQSEATIFKLLAVTFIPWLAPFLLGAIFHCYASRLLPLVRGKALWYAAGYTLLIFFGIWAEGRVPNSISGNLITPFHYVPLAFVILSAAYTRPSLSDAVLKKNDISYGLYIYHMPVINLWIYMAFPSGFLGAFVAILLVTVFAWMSWKIIERPALALKRYSIFSR